MAVRQCVQARDDRAMMLMIKPKTKDFVKIIFASILLMLFFLTKDFNIRNYIIAKWSTSNTEQPLRFIRNSLTKIEHPLHVENIAY